MISLWTASDDEEEKESYTIDATDCDLWVKKKGFQGPKERELGRGSSDYDDSRDEHCSGDNDMKTFQENSHNHVQDMT